MCEIRFKFYARRRVLRRVFLRFLRVFFLRRVERRLRPPEVGICSPMGLPIPPGHVTTRFPFAILFKILKYSLVELCHSGKILQDLLGPIGFGPI